MYVSKIMLRHFLYLVTQKNVYLVWRFQGGTCVFAKQLKRNIFGFPMKTISDKSIQRFHRQEKDICKCAKFSSTAEFQKSLAKNYLKHLIGNIIDRK